MPGKCKVDEPFHFLHRHFERLSASKINSAESEKPYDNQVKYNLQPSGSIQMSLHAEFQFQVRCFGYGSQWIHNQSYWDTIFPNKLFLNLLVSTQKIRQIRNKLQGIS